MKTCENCNSTNVEKIIIDSKDSHNLVVKYHCNVCGHEKTNIEPID
ncbi:MAG: hypothetical protein Q7R33_00900 [Nitrosarchaeum sp.]|nr:hypothetical protein [Nitrosarchaeum sp.]